MRSALTHGFEHIALAGAARALVADQVEGVRAAVAIRVERAPRIRTVEPGGQSGYAAVLVDQSAEEIDAFDRGRRVDVSGAGCRYIQADPAVRPSGVVMPDVDLQDVLEVPAVEDQGPVQAFLPHGAHPALGVGVGPRRRLHRMRTIGTDVCG